ncbi:endonuclease/exonuclease/phosphatase family protein [Vibrio aquaticus]|uniref:Endonuclease/exonuclease/phosphatase family protein n=1 Tax=Vibrio aquaticus TaxID=2496559 RepID=A0A432D0P8_9VIBR|nr:endonuclease/exonuclease/phosphatase family protein [Vibrio aquaticus]RTZ17500.1 endonuclease/exonuclease/phosphatase family protein [Vibrio aquaticus]
MRRGFVWLLVFAPSISWVILSFYESTWWIENIVAFPALFLFAYWVLAAILLLIKRWSAGAVCILLSGVFFLLSPQAERVQVSHCVTPISIAQYNLYYENQDVNAFINYLISQPKDLVVLQEVAPEIGEKLKKLDDIYPYYYGGQEGIGYPSSQMILSRSPLTDMSVYLTPDEQAIIRGTWHPNRHLALTLVAAHPPSPRTKALWYRRNAIIRTIESLNKLYPSDEMLVVGDFNLSSVSLRFGQMFSSFQTLPVASWPNWAEQFPTPDFSMIAIDHLWLKSAASGRRICDRRSIAKPNGSDHKLVETTIGY